MSLTGEIAIPCNEENRIRNRSAAACFGVVIYGGVEVIQPDPPGRDGEASEPPAERIEQQAAIPAVHHRHPQPYETRGTVAEVMGLPAALGHAGGAEEGRGDLAIARLGEPPIEGAQCQHQAVAPCSPTMSPDRGRAGGRRARAKAAARPRREARTAGRGATERRRRRRGSSTIWRRNRLPPRSINSSGPFSASGGPRGKGINPEVRIREIVGKRRDGDDARQRRRRPEDRARIGVSAGRREIARPSAARNRRGRRR